MWKLWQCLRREGREKTKNNTQNNSAQRFENYQVKKDTKKDCISGNFKTSYLEGAPNGKFKLSALTFFSIAGRRLQESQRNGMFVSSFALMLSCREGYGPFTVAILTNPDAMPHPATNMHRGL